MANIILSDIGKILESTAFRQIFCLNFRIVWLKEEKIVIIKKIGFVGAMFK